ncbi:tRNA lysidine(34) synthetase TilS [Fructobacillus evanidus]|uniref:tRNA(Ile)-lysidine synthase n=1 Tax=Fructobacillus evanidus TaxID=3064281 RepID=A0ABM9MTC3_9LACO|nr:tRNA(Ile)-lysidine synthase TilS/MesJ (TilS) [Fructobacillus sp. LMG 32999]CAK1234618.1 tRNA(Ile)-lysidine synthase TilS/MesJ (TilS) [Fructobacillus sp. LMG 32999]CAK1235092.1 tRNA(Ile)-lysidine synthase TilS/MesJ (TilS) [Fructobacillus sp. LMG 32999]CAK1235324.1 tRNA(Ile)-lysidine synthase TilS/MesJ (TilS) [Fructobacillus sp. LMG 32999]CAK1238711.1 tRNA(Ile)-lysidine synthase TilS/MesJ (TilS) [Fructobacillus sp. LMG 32999]
MKKTIAQTIKEKEWPQKVVVAVSGGLDSMTLLDSLHRFRPDIDLVVAHVNYQLRGAASDGDEAFVKNQCQDRQIPCYVKKVTAPGKSGVEAWARKVRYEFFDQVAQETSSQAVVLAQHQDDQVETLLLQLIRGGLAQQKSGIMGRSQYYLRPFLDVAKKELKNYAQDNQIDWREDATNADPSYTGRNQLRHEIIPALTAINAKAKDHLADFAKQEASDQALLQEQTKAFLPTFQADFHQVPKPWWKKTILLWLQKQGIYQVKNGQMVAILSLLANDQKPNGQVDLGDGWIMVKAYSQVQLIKEEKTAKNDRKPEELVLKLDQWQFFDRSQLLWTQKIPQKADQALILPEHLVGDLTLSLAKKDDRIPLKSGTKSVRRLLIDKKIPVTLRERTWLLKDQSQTVLAVWLGQQSWYLPAGRDRPNVAKQWLVWRIEEN